MKKFHMSGTQNSAVTAVFPVPDIKLRTLFERNLNGSLTTHPSLVQTHPSTSSTLAIFRCKMGTGQVQNGIQQHFAPKLHPGGTYSSASECVQGWVHGAFMLLISVSLGSSLSSAHSGFSLTHAAPCQI
jgi:hypothetical protein